MIVFLFKYYLQGTQYIFKYIILVANVFNYFRKTFLRMSRFCHVLDRSASIWGLAQIRYTATDRLMSYASISHCYQTSRGIASAEHTVYLAGNAFVYAFVTHLNLVYSFFPIFLSGLLLTWRKMNFRTGFIS